MVNSRESLGYYLASKRSGVIAKGLRIAFQRGSFYFQYRYSLGGRSVNRQIGKYPDVSLDEALSIAKRWGDEVKEKRLQLKLTSFSTEVEHGNPKPRITNGGLRSLSDLVAFFDRITDPLDRDLQNYWFLQICLPNMGRQLFEIKWSDVDLEKECIALPVQAKVAMRGYRPTLCFQNLSQVRQHLCHQKDALISLKDNLVFQQILDRNGAATEESMIHELGRIWNGYAINPYRIAHIAKKIALKKSNFRSEFIERIFEDSFWKSDISSHDLRCVEVFYEWWDRILSRQLMPSILKKSRQKIERIAAQAMK